MHLLAEFFTAPCSLMLPNKGADGHGQGAPWERGAIVTQPDLCNSWDLQALLQGGKLASQSHMRKQIIDGSLVAAGCSVVRRGSRSYSDRVSNRRGICRMLR